MDKLDIMKVDLKSAIAQLESALSRKSMDPVVQAGCIQYFEFCFELAWKSIKEADSPRRVAGLLFCRSCLQKAFELEWIQNEKVWLEMLEARNRIRHTPTARPMRSRSTNTCKSYLNELQSLSKRLS